MANMLFANNCNTTLNGGITNVATTMSVTSATGFPSPTGSQYFYCTLADAATQTTIEIVKVTAVSGTTFTIVRGQDGTSGTAFASGAVVSLRLVRASLNDFPKLDETNTFTADQAITGQLTTSAGLATTNSFTATAPADGLVMDYATGFGRFSAFAGDGFQWYNAGVANTKLMQLSSTGVITTATWNGATVGVGYGGTGLTTITAGYIPFGSTSSALATSVSGFFWDETNVRLGIYNTAPADTLDVYGTVRVTRRGGTTQYTQFLHGALGLQVYTSGAAGQMVFSTNGGTTQMMTLDPYGNLLVGVAGSDLFANRTTGFAVGPSVAGGQEMTIRASLGAKWSLTATNATHMYFYSDNGSTAVLGGNISTNGSVTSFNVTSDYRLKQNIVPLQSSLAKVLQLKPCSYNYIEGNQYSEGFIAHELQAIVPQAVTGEKDAVDEEGNPIYQAIDTSFLVATLVASIQELNTKFDAYVASHP